MADSPEEKKPIVPAPSTDSAPNPSQKAPPPAININEILLPKKQEGPSPLSAQRVNAGALFAQETLAATTPLAPTTPQPPTPAPTPPVAPPAPATVATAPIGATTPTPSVAPTATPAAKPKEESSIKPIQTYRSDIESVVEGKNISVVSIAAAEAERRGTQAASAEAAQKEEAPAGGTNLGRKIAYAVGGMVLLAIAGGIVALVATRPTTVPIPEAPVPPFISVDETRNVEQSWGPLQRTTLMNALVGGKETTNLALGLISRLHIVRPATSTTGNPEPISAAEVIGALAPNAPQELLRTLEPQFLLGIHSFDGNQPVLIIKADSYDVGYGAMLAWELSMKDDLAPLFNRTPRPRIPEEGAATSTASTTPQFLRTVFIDRVVENRDARVVENEFGDILLLWTFLDRSTIVITTNEYTLREVLSRAKTAPVVPIP